MVLALAGLVQGDWSGPLDRQSIDNSLNDYLQGIINHYPSGHSDDGRMAILIEHNVNGQSDDTEQACLPTGGGGL